MVYKITTKKKYLDNRDDTVTFQLYVLPKALCWAEIINVNMLVSKEFVEWTKSSIHSPISGLLLPHLPLTG